MATIVARGLATSRASRGLIHLWSGEPVSARYAQRHTSTTSWGSLRWHGRVDSGMGSSQPPQLLPCWHYLLNQLWLTGWSIHPTSKTPDFCRTSQNVGSFRRTRPLCTSACELLVGPGDEPPLPGCHATVGHTDEGPKPGSPRLSPHPTQQRKAGLLPVRPDHSSRAGLPMRLVSKCQHPLLVSPNSFGDANPT